jgi:hypothetical protein
MIARSPAISQFDPQLFFAERFLLSVRGAEHHHRMRLSVDKSASVPIASGGKGCSNVISEELNVSCMTSIGDVQNPRRFIT